MRKSKVEKPTNKKKICDSGKCIFGEMVYGDMVCGER
jgi:hypothetical protein